MILIKDASQANGLNSGKWKLLPGNIRVDIMCQQDCRPKLSSAAPCTLKNGITIDTGLLFCAVYLGVLTRSEGNKKCKMLDARFPLPKSKQEFNIFKQEFYKLLPTNSTVHELFVDMTYKIKLGTVRRT